MEVVAIGKGKNNPFNTFATPEILKDEAIKKKDESKYVDKFC